MKDIALIYWPKNGNVEKSGEKIVEKLGEDKADIFAITSIDMEQIPEYKLLIIGNSTIGADNWEDTHRSRWYEFFDKLEKLDLSKSFVAIYGLGDQILYPDHFVDGIKTIHEEFGKCGAKFIGRWPIEGYEHTDSESIDGEEFLGLALDEDQQAELTDERIEKWLTQIQSEASLR